MPEGAKIEDSNKITIHIQWFSVLAEERGTRSELLAIEPGCSGKELIDSLAADFPKLGQYRKHVRLAVNQNYEDENVILGDGDEVAFITPVSGG